MNQNTLDPLHDRLADELQNFQEIARQLKPSPGETPRLAGIEIGDVSLPLRQVIGGDHIVYIDFNRRYDLDARVLAAEREGRKEVAAELRSLRQRAGIMLADVSGHRMTDAVIAAMVHQAFLVGVNYELDLFGEVTTRLFEHINTRFYQTTSVNKYFTMIYGEIWEGGRFRFLSAGHQPPAVFSREYRRFARIDPARLISFPPVGLLPSSDPEGRQRPSLLGSKRRYEVNEISLLSPGDIIVLYTDGLAEHGDPPYFPSAFETFLADSRDEPLGEICSRLSERLLAYARPSDDISVVLIRRTA
jgi:serine phosphatase RsbU (regulator of sigma subunit)